MTYFDASPGLEPATVLHVPAPPVETATAGRARRLIRGPSSDPVWERPALALLLVGSAALYLWSLARNGFANEFYAAAVQAGSKSWKAFLFGSSDAGNSITVDKPPFSLWPQALSVRLFGLSSWSMLVPEALMGVASVGVLYATVKRWFGGLGGLVAGWALTLTPVAVLMFRFNNPDALLVLLMTVAAYTALRAVEDDRLRWYVLTGMAVGFGFLTKQLQVFLVLPGFAFALLLAGQGSRWRRLRGLLIAGVSLAVSAGWWVALVELWPASSRPYIGGSTNNSFLDLTFGYNGLGRITGNEAGGSGGGGGAGGGFSQGRGVARMISGVVGTQIAWLLPAAVIALVAGLVIVGRASRRDVRRASLVVWGGWLAVTAVVFSFMSGVFHEYYTVALAPAVAALVGIGASLLWAKRAHWAASATLASAVAVSSAWAIELIGRADWQPWLAPAVGVAGGVSSVGLLGVAVASGRGWKVPVSLPAAVAGLGLVAMLIGPAAWSLQTVSTSHTGSIVTAGPSVAGTRGLGGPGGAGAPSGIGGPTGRELPAGMEVPAGMEASMGSATGTGGTALPDGGGMPGGGGAAPSAALTELLEVDADQYVWVAAISGSTAAASYQLATEEAVMPIGGFTSSDPSPTLAQFQQYVAEGKIHYYLSGGQGGGLGGPGGTTGTSSQIASWVSATFTARTVGGVTVYDLTQPTS